MATARLICPQSIVWPIFTTATRKHFNTLKPALGMGRHLAIHNNEAGSQGWVAAAGYFR